MTLNAKIGVFTDFFRNMRLRKSLSFTRRRHRRQRHMRLWPKCIMVPMGRVQVICDFRNCNYWTGNAVGFRASRELCSNFLLFKSACRSAESCFLSLSRVATGPWKSLKKCSFFQGLESPWKWNRSLKVLEFDVKGPWKSLNLNWTSL